MNAVLLAFVALCYLTGSAVIVYGISLLTGLAGGLIAGGVVLIVFGALVARGMNASG